MAPKNIRFPDDLKDRIEAEAVRDRRTFSDEVRELIRLGLEKRDAMSAKGKRRSA